MAGQETNTTRGVSSNSGVGTGVHLPFGVGMGTGMEMGAEMNGLGVAGGLRVACSQGEPENEGPKVPSLSPQSAVVETAERSVLVVRVAC